MLQKQVKIAHKASKNIAVVLPWTQPWSVTKVDHTYKGIKNIKFLAEGSSLFKGTSPAIQWVVEFKYIKLMTMLTNVTSYSVESSPTTISSCSPTSATSTSPEGSSLLYEKANKGLGLAQDFMIQQTCSSECSSRLYKSSTGILLHHLQIQSVNKTRATYIPKHMW